MNRTLTIGSVLVGLVLLAALVSFVWTPYDPTKIDAAHRLLGPGADHLFGTDRFGRDVFSQLMVGARTTLYVGVVAVGIAALIGTPLGVLAGLAPQWLGEFVMRVNDLVLTFPTLLLAIMFGAVFGADTLTAMIAIGIATIPSLARIASSAGRSRTNIATRHVLPNIGGLLIVQSSVSFAIPVLAEAALSFLGFGPRPPTPSWGRML